MYCIGGFSTIVSELRKQPLFNRRNYERRIEIEDIDFSHDSFGFYRRQDEGTSEFFIFPDALIPAYRKINGVDFAAAAQWAEQPAIRQCKTSDWYTEVEVKEALDINPLIRSQDAAFVESVFHNLRRQSRQLRVGKDAELTISVDRKKHPLTCSKRWLPLTQGKQQNALVVDGKALQWVQNKLETESAFEAGQSFRTNRKNLESGPDMMP